MENSTEGCSMRVPKTLPVEGSQAFLEGLDKGVDPVIAQDHTF